MPNKSETIIVIENLKEGKLQTWGRLTEMCQVHENFKYYYLAKKKFPFIYKDWTFRKIKHRTNNL